jgi:uncharacterized protein (TIGR01777 family)
MPPIPFDKKSEMPVSAEDLFKWHEAPGAFERLAPPWDDIRVISSNGNIKDGAEVKLRIYNGPTYITMIAKHKDYIYGEQFCDYMVKSPFKSWEHYHKMLPNENGDNFSSVLHDSIKYQIPFQFISKPIVGGFIKNKITSTFEYRHQVTKSDLLMQMKYKSEPQRILLTGASGLIGSQLKPYLQQAGHQVVTLSTSQPDSEENIHWNDDYSVNDPARLSGFDAVIHLAGASIAGKRWSENYKKKIFESRNKGTEKLVGQLLGVDQKPSVFISASAIGYYGDRADDAMTETSAVDPNDSFLAETCEAWEQATQPLSDANVRVANARFGIVLSPAGGALKQMLPPFKFGMGGRLSSGKQWMSWIALDDALYALHHILATDSIKGAVNLVAPHAETNKDFTRKLCKVLRRPVGPPVPSFGLKILFGEMADALLLSSTRVTPTVLQETGFEFQYPDLTMALCHLLGKKPPKQ